MFVEGSVVTCIKCIRKDPSVKALYVFQKLALYSNQLYGNIKFWPVEAAIQSVNAW